MIILIVALVAIIPAGAWLHWAVTPVRVAFQAGHRLGRTAERLALGPARFVPAFRVGYRLGRRGRQAAASAAHGGHEAGGPGG
jgi:hypothetical protein